MQKKQINITPNKIQQDLAPGKVHSGVAFSMRNFRLISTGETNAYCLSVEKGSKPKELILVGVTIIGVQEINNIGVVIFATSNTDNTENPNIKDYIYYVSKKQLDSNDSIKPTTLYYGNLGFNEKNLIESIYYHEGDNYYKVYWVDGLNQPRLIMFNLDNLETIEYQGTEIDTRFNFNPDIKKVPTIEVTPIKGSSLFKNGVIQYGFNYSNKYGQQSNIISLSPIVYTSSEGRGLNPDGTNYSDTIFKIQIEQINTKEWDYVNIYRVERSIINGTPIVSRISSISLKNPASSMLLNKVIVKEDGSIENLISFKKYITYIDNGKYGESIDTTSLNFLGGNTIIANTLTFKDDTLFLGNIKYENNAITKTLKDNIKNRITIEWVREKLHPYTIDDIAEDKNTLNEQWSYESNLSNPQNKIAYFQKGEVYRLGVQFLYITGEWSEVIWVGDDENTQGVVGYMYKDGIRQKPAFLLNINLLKNLSDLPKEQQDELTNFSNNIVAVRPVCVYPSDTDRNIVCQGILCPTVYNSGDRQDNSPYVQSSWFARANRYNKDNKNMGEILSEYQCNQNTVSRQILPYEFMTTTIEGLLSYGSTVTSLPNEFSQYAEIQGYCSQFFNTDYYNWQIKTIMTNYKKPIISNKLGDAQNLFGVERRIVTLHSPELDSAFKDYQDISNTKLRIIGVIPLKTTFSDILVQSKSNFTNATRLSKQPLNDKSFYRSIGINKTEYIQMGVGEAVTSMLWEDYLAVSADDQTPGLYNNKSFCGLFPLYPWQRTGSLNNCAIPSSGNRKSMLEKKILSNLRICLPTIYTNEKQNLNTADIQLFRKTDQALRLKSWQKDLNLIYYGNVEKIINPKGMASDEADAPPNEFPLCINGLGLKEVETVYVYNDYTDLASKISKCRVLNGTNITGSNAIIFNMRNLGLPLTITNSTQGGVYDSSDLDTEYWIYNTVPIITTQCAWSKDPIQMNYKSTDHAVIVFDKIGEQFSYQRGDEVIDISQYILNLPGLFFKSENLTSQDYAVRDWTSPNKNSDEFWYGNPLEENVGFFQPLLELSINTPFDKDKNEDTNKESIITENLTDYTGLMPIQSFIKDRLTGGYFLMGELYRDNVVNRFGGTTEDALMNNEWSICGDTVNITSNDNIKVLGNIGDTYYQRYDHIKTLPLNSSDINQNIEIVSFLCETHINLDGRYDKNRGNLSNLTVSETNFNLFNSVYSQSNNFLSGSYLDSDQIQLNLFNTQIAWSLPKTQLQNYDYWTSIIANNSLNLDGDKGKLNYITRFKNDIYAFQDSGISKILYNDRVQVNTSDKIPIELTNSQKVSGKVYISQSSGSLNKYSIAETPNGIYFVDDLNNAICRLSNQDSIESLSDINSMYVWTKNNTYCEEYSLQNKKAIRTLYDKNTSDIYFTTDNEALAYNEKLGVFTSFYDYNKVNWLKSLGDKTYQWRDNKVYKMHEGDYTTFYGSLAPYTLEIIANPEFPNDIIFDTIELSTSDNANINMDIPRSADYYPFSELITTNEYQEASQSSYANLKKKFRIWRWAIGRDNKRNRIRNSWAKIKLIGNTKEKLEVYNINLNYYI